MYVLTKLKVYFYILESSGETKLLHSAGLGLSANTISFREEPSVSPI